MAQPADAAGPNLTPESVTTVEEMRVLLRRSENFALQLQGELTRLRQDTDQAVMRLQADLAAAHRSSMSRQMELIDVKMIAPTTFDGSKLESFKP